MNSTVLKKALPHVIAILVFLIVAVIYCRPALEGKVVFQSDMLQYKGMAQQSTEYYENMVISAVVAKLLSAACRPIRSPWITLRSIWACRQYTFSLAPPAYQFLLCSLCLFYILMLVLRINPWIGVLAALAYAYSTYDPSSSLRAMSPKCRLCLCPRHLCRSVLIVPAKNISGERC